MTLTIPIRIIAAMALAVGALLGDAQPARVSVAATLHATTARLAPGALVYPGPARGVPGSQTPRATDFVTACNSSVNGDAGTVGGAAIPAGTALSSTGCGTAVLLLDAPGPGRFQATFGAADDDHSGKTATVDVRVVGRDGGDLRVNRFSARRGHTSRISADVTRATAVILSFDGDPTTLVYAFTLRGGARTLRPAAGRGNMLPAGATPVNLAGATMRCNAAAATAPLTVTLVGIPAAGTATALGCGEMTLRVAPRSPSTLAFRYGATDDSAAGRETLSIRALAADGHLLRKATGVAYVGGGLRPLWVDLSGARSVVLAVDGTTNTHVAITGIGILPRKLSTYAIGDRTVSAGAPGASVAIDPAAMVSGCNALVGGSDTTVAGTPVFADAYVATNECGSTGLIFCNACSRTDGVFHARFGVADTSSAGGRPPTATVTVKDRDNHVLRRLTVRATRGTAGTRIDIGIRRASVLSFAFGGDGGVLYDLRLTGTATVSELIYAPTVPPVSMPGGAAIDPRRFTTSCNASVPDGDQRVVNATALDGWALLGQDCGEADLALAHSPYRGRTFDARVGLAIGEAPDTVTTIRFSVLDAAGKVIRHQDVTVIYGYGWQPLHIGLAGGSALHISWAGALGKVIVFAMSAR